MLSTQNIKLKGVSAKFAPRWIGPYLVTHVRGTAVSLQLPPELAKLHPTFHSSLVKPFHGAPTEPAPVEVEGGNELEYEVAAILDDKVMRGRQHFLVAWKGYDASSNTWEPAANLSYAKDLVTQYIEKKNSARKGKRIVKKT